MNKCLCAAGILLALTSPLPAETLEPLVVTASRMDESPDATLAPVTVITRDEIERSQAGDLMDLLRLQPGIDVARSGGPGADVSLFLRGTNSNQVLVLVDGVRAGSATTGQFAWQHLDPAQVERIEIVRGPRSTLYGADAVGGVIQIFTRKPSGAVARVEAGSHGRSGAMAGFGAGETVRLNLLASTAESEGFSATNADNAFAYDPDRDGYRNRSLSAGLEMPLGTEASFAIDGWHAEGRVEYDNGEQETRNQTLAARLATGEGTEWRQALRLGLAADRTDDHSAYPYRFETRRRSADWQHTLDLGERRSLVAGLEWSEERGLNLDTASGSAAFDRTLTHRGLYLNYGTPLLGLDLQAGLRRDYHDLFGARDTVQAAAGFDLSGATRLLASYGTAFKAPTFNDLFSPFGGNPALDPERSRSVDLGLRHRPADNQRLELHLYRTGIDDLIEWRETAPYTWEPHNTARATIDGAELAYRLAFASWSLDAAATWQKARDRASGEPLLRRPDRKLSLAATRTLAGTGSLRLESLLVDEARDVGDARLAGYGLVNLGLLYPLGKELRLEGRLENLFDREYHLAHGYNTPGRSLYLALQYAPGGH